jgi:hypothetical protein
MCTEKKEKETYLITDFCRILSCPLSLSVDPFTKVAQASQGLRTKKTKYGRSAARDPCYDWDGSSSERSSSLQLRDRKKLVFGLTFEPVLFRRTYIYNDRHGRRSGSKI